MESLIDEHTTHLDCSQKGKECEEIIGIRQAGFLQIGSTFSSMNSQFLLFALDVLQRTALHSSHLPLPLSLHFITSKFASSHMQVCDTHASQ